MALARERKGAWGRGKVREGRVESEGKRAREKEPGERARGESEGEK